MPEIVSATPSTPPSTAAEQTAPLKSVSLPRIFLGYAADVVLPMALYYVLHRLGISDTVALGASIVIALVATIVNTIRRKKLDAIGILVIFEIALSIVLFLLLKDRRLILAKPSFYSGLVAIYLIVMAFGSKPMNYDAIRNVGSDGDPRRAAAFDAAWDENPKFRTALRTAEIGWGIAFLADAILRVIIVFTTEPGRAVWLSNVPHIAAIALIIVFSAGMGRINGRIVDAQFAKMYPGEPIKKK
jgi:hypothetical protein